MRGITRDCIVEMVDRKILWVFVVVTAVTIAGFIGVLSVSASRSEVEMIGLELKGLQSQLLLNMFDYFLYFMVFLTVLATAGLIPDMFVKGRADFYLSKPISRASLLINKIFAIFLVYGGTIAVCGFISYGIVALVFGVFDIRVVNVMAINLAVLLVWLSITSFGGILAGSTGMALMIALLVGVLQWILRNYETIGQFIDSRPTEIAVSVLYYIVPKMGEMSSISSKIANGILVTEWLPLYSSLIFAFALIGVTAYIFKKKSY